VCHEFERRESHSLLKSAINHLYANAYPNFSAMFFLSEVTRQRFLSLYDYPKDNTHTIAHGNESMFLAAAANSLTKEDLHSRYSLQPHHQVILFFGALVPSKGIPDLIEAFALIASKQAQAKLIIAGYPTKHIDLPALQQQVQQHDLTGRVFFDTRYIPISSIAPLMQLATVVVYPYQSSTQSGSLQVAYAFGRPVIATTVGGLPEVVDDGKSGFLVAPSAPKALAEKITILLESPELADQMGKHAKHLSETRYSWQPIAEKVANEYLRLANNKS
jgi:glycosyltransferase involved in cell wall biosynthesis